MSADAFKPASLGAHSCHGRRTGHALSGSPHRLLSTGQKAVVTPFVHPCMARIVWVSLAIRQKAGPDTMPSRRPSRWRPGRSFGGGRRSPCVLLTPGVPRVPVQPGQRKSIRSRRLGEGAPDQASSLAANPLEYPADAPSGHDRQTRPPPRE